MIVIVYLVVGIGLRQLGGLLERGLKLEPAGGVAISQDEMVSLPGTSAPSTSEAAVRPGPHPAGANIAMAKSEDEMIRDRLEDLVNNHEAKVARVLKSWMSEPRRS